MSTSCRSCNPGCTVIAVAASLILGVIAAFLLITEAIAVTPAFLWVLLGIAVVYLAVSLVAAALFRNSCCDSLCSIVNTMLAGTLGTVLLSVVLLGVELDVASVFGAVLTGALIFFFFLTVIAVACLVRCFFNCNS